MTRYVALLRAVNVGGTGKLPMPALRSVCEAAGFGRVRTYIASGNVVFECEDPTEKVNAVLSAALLAYTGKRVGLVLRTAAEMRAVLEGNPFRGQPDSRTVAIFLDGVPPDDLLEQTTGRTDEAIAAGVREIYVHYPQGIGRSRLRIKAARDATARNMSTVAALVKMTTEGQNGDVSGQPPRRQITRRKLELSAETDAMAGGFEALAVETEGWR